MFLQATFHGNGTYQIYCKACQAPLDIVDYHCIRWHLENSLEPYCFDCDGHSDVIPEALLSGGDLMILPNLHYQDVGNVHIVRRPVP